MPSTRIEDVINKPEDRSASPHEQERRLAGPGRQVGESRKRTRTGCLNCRRKRRKCDEAKPTCEGCQARREVCEWGVKVSFRPENAQTMKAEHPSMLQAVSTERLSYKIVNVTSEVIRDYFEESTNGVDDARTAEAVPLHIPLTPKPTPLALQNGRDTTQQDLAFNILPPIETSQASPSPPQPTTLPNLDLSGTPLAFPPELFLSPQYSDSTFEDGIFLPGSQYQELHATLRSRIIDTARSTAPSRLGSPDLNTRPGLYRDDTSETVDEESRRLAHLSIEQEYVLWQNYINEVAPWLDKFDIYRHFELVLPMLAKHHPHIKYSILALSSRQMELKEKKPDNSCSLALYQHAIHLLSPLLQLRTTEVLASCVVLCVLEMMSCSPKAWRRHLDGCAALIQALGISGGCGGLEQAIFWCFARMDICGGLISSERTLIPLHKWMDGGDITSDVNMLLNLHGDFSMYANHVVYLTAQVVDLLCSSGKWEQRHRNLAHPMSPTEYFHQWTQLFELLERWYRDRPEEMKTLLTISAAASNKPFSTLLFGNGPGISGNQMYHTAALLMLKYKPPHVQFAKKPPSVLWHARQICAISISNHHHGSWSNSIQPLWLAGQHMSHSTEHRAILDIYERIERELGWATKWRADDLKEHWGDMDM
ncbi:Putative zn(2)-C6 fungal-type DNA-binding domain, fungal transcription factor [Septoria linicola]|uniref:Zn(2)-C6 fungal-type DNA-binding domain, fungal transcription factor n=1 Tax=Septoria linicola TaxID=215465 RepID=A0A9Q9EKY7_9PEZI|nr:putative zn(2)-C6 fungal-type DNA-binding domain, fungal transcription factor [Septoria linicola]USW54555.1 Putative zn(2)-C6 fungal-type DNA-binding domain, fungal transcription factor [Septoria linicola]